MSTDITVAYGDGASAELMESALLVLREAAAPLNIETIETGSRIYAMDYPPGILPSAFKKLDHSKILLLGHTQKPDDAAYKNVADVVRGHYELGDEHRITLSHGEYDAMAHINDRFALFEAGQNSMPAHMLAWVMLLEHIGYADIAINIRQALENTLAHGVESQPLMERIFNSKKSEPLLFAEAVASRLSLSKKSIES